MKVLAQGELVDRPSRHQCGFEFPYAHAATIGFRDIHQVRFALRVARGEPVGDELAALWRAEVARTRRGSE